MAIEWPCDLITSEANESALRIALEPFTLPTSLRLLGWDLDADTRARIVAIGRQHGFTVRQAFALRRGMLKEHLGIRRFMALNGNSHEKQKLIAEAFEATVDQHIRSVVDKTIAITTESDRKANARRQGVNAGPTPDFTFDPPIKINRHKVYWLDAKMMYASSCFLHLPFCPESRFFEIAEKYTSLFGTGAFLLAGGFTDALASALMRSSRTLLIDGTPIDMTVLDSVIETDRSKTFTFEEMREALGVQNKPTPSPPKPRDAIPEASTTPKEHEWGSRILTGADGPWTYHYHLCAHCGKEGRRKRYSNRKATICSDDLCVPAEAE